MGKASAEDMLNAGVLSFSISPNDSWCPLGREDAPLGGAKKTFLVEMLDGSKTSATLFLKCISIGSFGVYIRMIVGERYPVFCLRGIRTQSGFDQVKRFGDNKLKYLQKCLRDLNVSEPTLPPLQERDPEDWARFLLET